MILEHYAHFVKVAEVGTISAASRQLLIAQPALSHQIKLLEQEYGTPLFVRHARHLTLTDAGHILYERAKNMLSMEDIARKEIQAVVSGLKGTLCLGFSASQPDHEFARHLLEFGKLYPEIGFDFYGGTSAELVKCLVDESVEIAVFYVREDLYPQIGSAFSRQEPLAALFRRGSGLLPEDISPIPISALYGVPLCTTKIMQPLITNACVTFGFSPTFKAVTSSRMSSMIWGKDGSAVTIFPTSNTAEYENAQFCCRILNDPKLRVNHSINYLLSHHFSNVAQLFLNFIVERLSRE